MTILWLDALKTALNLVSGAIESFCCLLPVLARRDAVVRSPG